MKLGLRPRHFEKISEIVGFEIKGDDMTSFRQLLRLQACTYVPFMLRNAI